MRIRTLVASVAAVLFATALPAAGQTNLNVVTAGDQNMVDYVNDFLAPRFEKLNPGVDSRRLKLGQKIRVK